MCTFRSGGWSVGNPKSTRKRRISCFSSKLFVLMLRKLDLHCSKNSPYLFSISNSTENANKIRFKFQELLREFCITNRHCTPTVVFIFSVFVFVETVVIISGSGIHLQCCCFSLHDIKRKFAYKLYALNLLFIHDNKERIILYRGRGPFEDTVWGCSLARSVVIFCPIPVVAAVPRGVQGAGGGGRGHVVHESPWGGHSEGGCGAVPVGRSGGVRAAPCAVTRRPAARHGMVSRVERFIKDIGRLPFDITQFIVRLLQLETYKTIFFLKIQTL